MLILLTALSFTAFAGTIRGDIKNAKDSSNAEAVTVSIPKLNRMMTTDFTGHFELINLPDGTYEVEFGGEGYKPEKRTVTLAGGGDATLDVMLTTKSNALKVATVKANRVTRTENAVVLEIKKSNTVVSGISAAQISKTQDRNAADVVKRIPGVTIQDDRFIVVRGLAERYNTVWLNDAGAPSSEVDKKSFSFDIIPSGLIDRILIFKTPSPDLPGDFAGGMVKVYTSSLPSKNAYTVGLSTSYRVGSTGSDFNYTTKSSTDWLGYDNGLRSIPTGVPGKLENGNPDLNAITKSFGNDWKVNTRTQTPDLRFNIAAANIFKLGAVRLGNTFGLSYSKVSTNYNVTRWDWDSVNKQFEYNDKQSQDKVNAGLMDNVALALGNSRIEWRNLYNQIGTNLTTLRTLNPDTAGYNGSLHLGERSYAFGYESRATYTTQLSGTHHNDSATRQYNWTIGYTDVFRNQPDLRRIRYDEEGNNPGVYHAQIPSSGSVDPVNGGGRFYSQLNEHIYSFNQQFTQKIKVSDKFGFDLNLGSYLEYKSRSFSAREFGYGINPSANSYPLLHQPIDSIFLDNHVGGLNNFTITEDTRDYDHYTAQNRLIAGYASVNVPVTEKFKVLTGVRYENNMASLQGSDNQHATVRDIKTDFFLPSINMTYNFTAKTLLRLAYGKTVNRPEFRETAPFYFYDFDRRAGTYGALFPTSNHLAGDTLEVAQIHNIDARYEWYPAPGELVHAGVFYKQFNNPIQQVSYGTGDSRSFTYANGKSAYCYGLEVDVRKNLAFLGGSVWKDFTLVSNVSVSKSELTVDTANVVNALAKYRLEGQSDYVVNFGTYYTSEKAALQGSILYNVYGPRLYSIGTAFDPSIGELPFHSLDLAVSKTFFKHYVIDLGAQNLLDGTVRFRIDTDVNGKFDAKNDKPFSQYKPGRYFTLGVKVRF